MPEPERAALVAAQGTDDALGVRWLGIVVWNPHGVGAVVRVRDVLALDRVEQVLLEVLLGVWPGIRRCGRA